MAEEREDLAHEAARGRHEATPWLLLGSVALTIGVVAALVIVALVVLWIVV